MRVPVVVACRVCGMCLPAVYLRLKDDWVCTMAEALKSNTTVTSIDLSSNEITSTGVEALAALLRVNSTIKELKMLEQDPPSGALGTALCSWLLLLARALTMSVVLCIAGVSRVAEQKLAEAVAANTTVTRVSLSVSHEPGLLFSVVCVLIGWAL